MPGPYIEELANSRAAVTPGWAYVPDTGYDPSKAPIVPSGARQRAGRGYAAASAGVISVRQQNQIKHKLEELDKENYRDVHITVPNRPRDIAARGIHGKLTPAVRKILQSQKNFSNHLADEEAALANQQTEVVVTAAPQKSSQMQVTKTGPKRGRYSTTSNKATDANAMEVDTDQDNDTTHDQMDAHELSLLDKFQALDPLVRPYAPPVPTTAEIEALMAAPPLSYSAARATATRSSVRPRQFCEMCGYWGLMRCKHCGVRLCGLECQTSHLETRRCQNYYG